MKLGEAVVGVDYAHVTITLDLAVFQDEHSKLVTALEQKFAMLMNNAG